MPRIPAGLVLAEQQPPSPRRRRLLRLFAAGLVVVVAMAGYLGVRALIDSFNPSACWTTGSTASGPVEVTPEQAGNAATITAVAVRRGLPTRAATIALATAFQESKLRNLRYGDRDSVGLFQQRPSQGWGTVEQILDPVYAANAFYDKLVKVKDYLTRPLTAVAQDVQRSGAPLAYAQHEDEAAALAAALTGAAPATLVCRLDPPDTPPTTERVAAALATDLGEEATVAGRTLTVQAESALAWAIASWAVARAESLGIGSVEVADRRWSRAGPEAWTTAPARAGVVVITLAGPA